MKCTTFARELRSLNRDRGDLPPSMERHASACARCRKAWEDEMLIDTAVVRWQARVPRVDLADDVLAAAHSVLPRSAARSRGAADGARLPSPGATGAITVAMLALMLVVVGLTFPAAPRQSRDVALTRSDSKGATTNAANGLGESPSIAEGGTIAGDERATAERRRQAGTLTLVAEIGGFVPGPWELASVLDDEVVWPADAAGWLDPRSLLPAPE